MVNLDVIIPVLMPSMHLSKLRSFLSNAPMDIRFNYVLDYSSEKVAEEEIFDAQPNERFFRGAFGSPGFSRNDGLDVCDSKYVCFWDVDDEPDVDQLLSMMNKFKNSKRDLAIGNWSYLERFDRPRGVSPRSVGNSPGLWRFAFKRELIGSLRFGSYRWGEDQLFLLQVFAKKPSVFTFDKIIYRYTRHSRGGLTTKHENVVDLAKVHGIWPKSLNKIEGNARICFEVMYLKQVYSVAKYGGLKMTLKVLLKSYLLAPMSIFRNIVFIIFRLPKCNSW